MTTTKSPIPLELAKTAFLPIDLQKGIVNSGQLFPYDATTILSNNQLIAEQLKHTPAWNILVNVDITSFQYLSVKNDRAQAGAFYTPLKNLLIYYLNLPPKEHKTHSRSLNIIQVLFLERL